MRRLNGKKEVEEIIFGSELWGYRRQRQLVVAAVLIFTLGAIIATGVFALLFADGGTDAPDTDAPVGATDDSTGEEESTSRDIIERPSGSDKEPSDDNSNGGEQSTEEKNAIIYKDFSTGTLNIVNKTVFDISHIHSASSSLTKYYDKDSRAPIVLILHTYTSDRYADSQSKYGVCAAGQVLSEELNAMGIGTVYSSAVHDGDMNDPLENSRETIEFYLKMYPSIKYVFDLGVMQEYAGESIVATRGEYLGSLAAQVRILVAGNNISSGRENLRLAVEINKNLSRKNMNLAREIVYSDSIKNSSFTPYYLEIFIGSTGNCESEATLTARVLADAFAQFLI